MEKKPKLTIEVRPVETLQAPLSWEDVFEIAAGVLSLAAAIGNAC